MSRSQVIARCRWFVFAFLLFLVTSSAPAQHDGGIQTGADTLLALPSVSLRLSHLFLVAGSETCVLGDSSYELRRDTDYTLDGRYGIIRFDSAFVYGIASPDRGPATVIVRYRFRPFNFRDRYAIRELVPVPAGEDTLRVARPQSEFDLDDIFGRNLQKSGSIVRGITVGSNRDFSVNSGLRLQLAGSITPDIDVAASLTDENTPIQPEGTTQTLQEFDKVFVEFTGSSFDVTLGDFNIEFEGTEFGRLSRKLQGAKGSLAVGSRSSVAGNLTAAGAVPRGKFHTNQFPGIEGVQGPYRLSGRNGESDIIVIAGTERVFINGEQMVRGEINDYTIDYSLSEITFTSRRLVTAASRVVVDFEYTDRQYGRTFIAGQGGVSLFGEKIQLGIGIVREADDRDDPIDFALTDSARQILADAGGDRNKAFISGITVVDSNGFYIRIDSVVTGDSVRFYRYQPGPSAQYVISFSFIGPGQGDYDQQSPGVFTWVGTGRGSYLPVKFLSLPQTQTIVDYELVVQPLDEFTVRTELAQSQFDANTFSTLAGSKRSGNAFSIEGRYAAEKMKLFGEGVGSMEVLAKGRFIDDQFVPIDRINEIEFSRNWGLDTLYSGDEKMKEVGLTYRPWQELSVGGGFGSLDRGDITRSTRKHATAHLVDTSGAAGSYLLEDIRSEDHQIGTASDWLRQNGNARYRLDQLMPTFRFEQETRNIRRATDDSLTSGSFRFDVLAPGLRIFRLGPVDLSGEFEWRNDGGFDPSTRSVVRAFETFTQSYQAMLRGLREVNSTLDVTLRKRSVTPAFEATGQQDIRTVLVRNQTRYAPESRWLDANAFYEVSTQQSSVLQRIFLKVTPGTGNYRYLGDLNNNGVADESEFEMTRYDGDYVVLTVPTSNFLPVIDLSTSLRVGLRPAQVLTGEEGWLASALSVVSTESYIRVDEKSTEPDLKQIYLLHFSSFRKDSTTIAGSQLFTQDITFFDQSPLFTTRLRYQERKSLTRYGDGPEHRYGREQSIRIRTQPVTEFSQQFDYLRQVNESTSASTLRPDFGILVNTFTIDLSYRPEQSVELGLNVELAASTDRVPDVPTEADLNSQALRLVYSFEGIGQARGEVTREEVGLRNAEGPVPFELTDGRMPGKTWLWSVGFDYRVTQFIQATFSYDGRSEESSAAVHTARAEVQAFF